MRRVRGSGKDNHVSIRTGMKAIPNSGVKSTNTFDFILANEL